MVMLILEGRCMKRIMLNPNFANVVARHNIGMNEIADRAKIGRATLYALQNPETHPHRKGGMHRTTAWKIVNAFSDETGISPDDAWGMLMVEVDEPRQRRRAATE